MTLNTSLSLVVDTQYVALGHSIMTLNTSLSLVVDTQYVALGHSIMTLNTSLSLVVDTQYVALGHSIMTLNTWPGGLGNWGHCRRWDSLGSTGQGPEVATW